MSGSGRPDSGLHCSSRCTHLRVHLHQVHIELHCDLAPVALRAAPQLQQVVAQQEAAEEVAQAEIRQGLHPEQLRQSLLPHQRHPLTSLKAPKAPPQRAQTRQKGELLTDPPTLDRQHQPQMSPMAPSPRAQPRQRVERLTDLLTLDRQHGPQMILMAPSQRAQPRQRVEHQHSPVGLDLAAHHHNGPSGHSRRSGHRPRRNGSRSTVLQLLAARLDARGQEQHAELVPSGRLA